MTVPPPAPSTRSPTSPRSPTGWAYLDTAATAQKPQAVIDAITRGYGETYATVHRGVYQRSADMTLAYEAARARVARFIGGEPTNASSSAARPRRSTSSRNAGPATQLKAGDRILLSMLEHHSNIVPWQMVAERDRRRDRRRAADRRRPHRPRRDGDDADRPAQARRARPRLQRPRLGARRAARRRARPRASARRSCSTAARRSRACRSTSPRSAATSTSSPGTSSTARPGSACCGAGRNCSTRCRRSRAAAR